MAMDGTLTALKAVAETLRISVPTLTDVLLKRASLERCDARLEAWSERLLRHAQLELTVSGRELLEPGRPYVVMSNHRSHYDVPLLFQAWPGRLRMVAKTELFRIPIFGPALRESGFIEVDRGNRERAIASLKVARERLAQGISVWIAPEGTRARDGQLHAFKKGGFRMAMDARLPIAPVAIAGSDEVLPAGGRSVTKGRRVHISMGAPITLPEHDDAPSREALMAQVHAAIEALLVDAEARRRG